MTTQKASLTRHAVTQTGDPLRVQIGASGIDPVGAVKPAVADSIGLVPSIRFDTGVEMIAGVTFAIPDKADPTQPACCRIGWGATTNTGDVKWSLLYKWVGVDDDIAGAIDGTEIDVQTVSTTVNGYRFSEFDFDPSINGHRVLEIQIHRNGTDLADTCAGAAHVIGILCDFIAGV